MPHKPRHKLASQAPNPGYDRPSPPPKPRRAPSTEVYPKPFISSLTGQGTINANAQKQLEKALKEQ